MESPVRGIINSKDQSKGKTIVKFKNTDIIFVKQNQRCFEVYLKDKSKLELYLYSLVNPKSTNIKMAERDEWTENTRGNWSALKRLIADIDSRFKNVI